MWKGGSLETVSPFSVAGNAVSQVAADIVEIGFHSPDDEDLGFFEESQSEVFGKLPPFTFQVRFQSFGAPEAGSFELGDFLERKPDLVLESVGDFDPGASSGEASVLANLSKNF